MWPFCAINRHLCCTTHCGAPRTVRKMAAPALNVLKYAASITIALTFLTACSLARDSTSNCAASASLDLKPGLGLALNEPTTILIVLIPNGQSPLPFKDHSTLRIRASDNLRYDKEQIEIL